MPGQPGFLIMDQELQKKILEVIKKNGGQASVGYLGVAVGSKVLSGEKTGIDKWKHNLHLLIDSNKIKEIGEGLRPTSSVRITEEGESFLKGESNDGDILKLSPEFYGVGINLKSLWRKIKSWF